MTDHFALLDEPRRPWIDAEGLKAKFLKVCAECHPDRSHQADPESKTRRTQEFIQFNTAYNCLRDPKERLLHLWQLETGKKPAELQEIPPELLGIFEQIATLTHDVEGFLKLKEKASSAVEKANLFERAMEWKAKLEGFHQEIEALRQELFRELALMNREWEEAPVTAAERQLKLPLQRLEQIYRMFSYLNRWQQKTAAIMSHLYL